MSMRNWKPGDPIFDLEVIAAGLAEADVQEDPHEPGECIRSMFLGTVFALTPSGKYYQPFACSNLDFSCEKCGGSGEVGPSTNKHKLEKATKRYEAMQREFRKLFDYPEGSPERQWRRDNVNAVLSKPMHRLEQIVKGGSCGYCGGSGSREAQLDALWQEQAEKELETIEASLQSGDGDPCDLFAVQSAPEWFVCECCQQTVSADKGADDDEPNQCDDCYAAKQQLMFPTTDGYNPADMSDQEIIDRLKRMKMFGENYAKSPLFSEAYKRKLTLPGRWEW